MPYTFVWLECLSHHEEMSTNRSYQWDSSRLSVPFGTRWEKARCRHEAWACERHCWVCCSKRVHGISISSCALCCTFSLNVVCFYQINFGNNLRSWLQMLTFVFHWLSVLDILFMVAHWCSAYLKVRPPMPQVFFFLVDVSVNAVSIGAVASACSAINRVLTDLGVRLLLHLLFDALICSMIKILSLAHWDQSSIWYFFFIESAEDFWAIEYNICIRYFEMAWTYSILRLKTSEFFHRQDFLRLRIYA